jgi:hypothetical protein
MSIENVTLFKHTSLARITRTSQPFRLLEIKPSSEPSSQIECTLHHANLLTKPKFKALSYVWGDQSLKVPILLDSKRYDVTRNCYGALLRLRELGETTVWIDAICIDQGKNSQEKSSQIPLMNYIYPAAKEVIVWLGHVEEEREPNARDIEWLALSLLREFSVAEVRTPEQFLEIAQRGENPEYRLKALSSLLMHPWFSRLWTHQELILSTIAIFALDYHTMTFDEFQLGTQIIHRAEDQMTFRQLPTFLSKIFGDFYGFRDGLERARIRAAARTDRRNPFYLPHQRISLLDQVISATRFQCSEPRDRIYAMLGLLDSKISQRIQVDYEKPLEEVYTDFAEAVIDATHSLEELTRAGLGRGPSCCPSWVQDWTKNTTDQPKMLRYSKYSACCSTRANYSINRNKKELIIRGLGLDSVLETVIMKNEELIKDSQHHLTGAKGLRTWRQSFEEYPTGCDPLHAWIKTITADMDGDEVMADRQTPETLDAYIFDHNFHDSSQEEKRIMMQSQETDIDEWIAWILKTSVRFQRAVAATGVNRTFFISKGGYMGMGPKALAEADLICVVLGCEVPLLLRKNGDHYLLVGECFVWGLMDGEAMRMKRRGDDWLDTFRLC